MIEAIALSPQDIGCVRLDSLLALVAFPSKRKTAVDLSASIETILKGVSVLLDDMLLQAVAAQSQDEFNRIRAATFPNYASAVIALANIVRTGVTEQIIERVSDESFCELESEFRAEGLARFGSAARDQAMFTVSTLRRTSRLIAKITNAEAKTQSPEDHNLASNFVFYTTWTQFHMDCLLVAIRFNKTIQLAVLPAVIDGLRAAVNAYGYARQGLDLRFPRLEPQIAALEWDEEDQELLDASMRDMEAQVLDD